MSHSCPNKKIRAKPRTSRGLDICPSCRPAIMEYAKSMNITELEIYELGSNKKYLFKDTEINLVKNGGKSWRRAEIHH